MASSSGWHFHGYSFPLDMFSFSLNPEIVSFFWRKPSQPEFESVRHLQPAKLFHIVLSPEHEEASLIATLHYTVVTTGILVIVGLSSFCSYKLLQCVRETSCSSMLQKLRHFVVNPFVLHWNSNKIREDGVKNNNSKPVSKRPSELQLVSSPVGNRLLQKSRDSSLERRLLTKVQTPLADCDIASGEEDINDIQGQYFGPTVKSSTLCMELLGSSPEDTPTHEMSTERRRRRRDDAFC